MGNRLSHFRLSGGCFHEKRTKFRVKVIKDDQPQGAGKLEVTNEDVILYMHNKSCEKIVWPIRSIRRYGTQDGVFSFESGRRCETGPAFYQFPCKHADHVFLVIRERVEVIAAKDLEARVSFRAPESIPADQLPTRHSLVEQPGEMGDPLYSSSYLNCDSSGRYNGDLIDTSSRSASTLAEPRSAEFSSGLTYAELDLKEPTSMPEKDRRGQLERNGSGVSGMVCGPRASKKNAQVASQEDTLSHRFSHGSGTGTVAYVQIDATKSKAAANLERSVS